MYIILRNHLSVTSEVNLYKDFFIFGDFALFDQYLQNRRDITPPATIIYLEMFMI